MNHESFITWLKPLDSTAVIFKGCVFIGGTSRMSSVMVWMYTFFFSPCRKNVIFPEVTKYRAAIIQKPVPSFRVVYKKHTLTLDDLSTLADQNWLNDQVIIQHASVSEWKDFSDEQKRVFMLSVCMSCSCLRSWTCMENWSWTLPIIR